jgi:hypothetical protein
MADVIPAASSHYPNYQSNTTSANDKIQSTSAAGQRGSHPEFTVKADLTIAQEVSASKARIASFGTKCERFAVAAECANAKMQTNVMRSLDVYGRGRMSSSRLLNDRHFIQRAIVFPDQQLILVCQDRSLEGYLRMNSSLPLLLQCDYFNPQRKQNPVCHVQLLSGRHVCFRKV